MESQINAHRNTVLLLGAGASHGTEFTLPLMADILRRDRLQGRQYRSLDRALTVFEESGATVDLEEFLTHLDMTAFTFLDRWNRTRNSEFSKVAESARRQLGDYLAACLSHDGKGASDHVELFRTLPKATILTLNYDRIADSSLMDADGGPRADGIAPPTGRLGLSYQLLRPTANVGATVTTMQNESGLLLKLHGSVNWFSCPRHECISHQEIIEASEQRWGWRPANRSVCVNCGAQLSRVIVAPTLAKQFVDNPRLELLWHLAHKRLMSADELIVIGVALPASDFRLRWLLGSSVYLRNAKKRHRDLIIVNPDHEAVQRVETAARTKAIASFSSMKEFLGQWRPYATLTARSSGDAPPNKAMPPPLATS